MISFSLTALLLYTSFCLALLRSPWGTAFQQSICSQTHCLRLIYVYGDLKRSEVNPELMQIYILFYSNSAYFVDCTKSSNVDCHKLLRATSSSPASDIYSEVRHSVLLLLLFFFLLSLPLILAQLMARRRDQQTWLNVDWVCYRNKNFPSWEFSQIICDGATVAQHPQKSRTFFSQHGKLSRATKREPAMDR